MKHRRLLHTGFDVLNKIAEETNHTMAQVVFNRLLSRPTITRLAIGGENGACPPTRIGFNPSALSRKSV